MTRTEIIEVFMAVLLYSMFFFGIALAFQRSFVGLYRVFAARKRLSAKKKHVQSMDPVMAHLHYLLNATLKNPCSPERFLFYSGLLFFLLTVNAMRSFHILTAMGIGAGSAFMPYLLLRIRLESKRRRGSTEGEKVVSELLRQYRIADKNIYEALERVVPEIRDCRVCCPLLHKMLLRLRSTGNALEIRETAQTFSFAVGTNWSHMLAACIRLAAERGFDVSIGMEDVLVQMRQAKERVEERRRLNSEAMRLTVFMVPFLYICTIGLSVYYLELPLSRFLKNQIGTPEGVIMLMGILFLFLFNLAALEMVNNQKMDF